MVQDDVEAVKWYKKAAEQGDVKAQYCLGFCYAQGQGVDKDNTLAAKWSQRAADQGEAASQFILGVLYSQGECVPKDFEIAYKWWSLSAAADYPNAAKNLEILSKRMTDLQIVKARGIVSAWKPKKEVAEY